MGARISITRYTVICIVIVFLSFFAGLKSGMKMEFRRHAREITLAEYRNQKDSGSSFTLIVERPSCRYCAVVTSAIYKNTYDVPVYLLNLEPYLDTPEYERVKEELEVTYLPAFKYITNGEIRYNMNNPLESGYYEAAGTERQDLYRKMQDKIEAFFFGLSGNGPVINEALLDGTIHGVLEKQGEGQS